MVSGYRQQSSLGKRKEEVRGAHEGCLLFLDSSSGNAGVHLVVFVGARFSVSVLVMFLMKKCLEKSDCQNFWSYTFSNYLESIRKTVWVKHFELAKR